MQHEASSKTRTQSSSRSGLNCRPKGWTEDGPPSPSCCAAPSPPPPPIRVMTALSASRRNRRTKAPQARHAWSKRRATCRVRHSPLHMHRARVQRSFTSMVMERVCGDPIEFSHRLAKNCPLETENCQRIALLLLTIQDTTK